jgi:hypothetical protein
MRVRGLMWPEKLPVTGKELRTVTQLRTICVSMSVGGIRWKGNLCRASGPDAFFDDKDAAFCLRDMFRHAGQSNSGPQFPQKKA